MKNSAYLMSPSNFMNWTNLGKAVITGASSGIGAMFAKKFAEQHFSLILIDIQEEALKSYADELSNLYSISVECIVGDLSDESSIKAIADQLKQVSNIDILVNNAGFGSKGHFASNNFDRQIAMFKVHNLATIYFTRAVLQNMLNQDRGAIINLSSMGGFLPSANAVMYASTKAFTRVFSESIALELMGTNVRIQALCPGFTHTKFHSTGEKKGFDKSVVPQFLWMTPEKLIEYSLRGIKKNRSVVLVPGTTNKLIKWLQTNPLTRKTAMRKTMKV